MTMLATVVLALCSSVQAFAPARMARPAAAVRAAPMRTAPVMQFGKKKLTPEEVRPRGPQELATGAGARPALPVSGAVASCSALATHAMHVPPVAEARGAGLLARRVAVCRLWLHL